MIKVRYIKSEDARSKSFDDFIVANYPHFLEEDEPDLIIVTGGDGAMLHAIQSHRHYKVPFLGHAAGTLNFLMNDFENYKEIIKNILKNKYDLHVMETTSIKVDDIGYAVNDVVIGSSIMGYHSFKVTSDDSSFKDFTIKGTGICVSTDLGSTGYNFNLGGPVLPLGSNLWALQGIVCNRYLNDILPIGKIYIECDPADKSAFVYVDGINKHKIKAGEKLDLTKGDPIKIAFLDKTQFIRKRIEITSRYRKS